MSWAHPLVLLALVVPALGLLMARRIGRRPPAPGRRQGLPEVSVSGSRLSQGATVLRASAVPVLVAVAFAIIAVAQPRWGASQDDAYVHTREVMIALDISRSMLAEDVAPNRLEQARRVTRDLLDGLRGESVGLIVFAGTAFVQVPMSPDYQIIREFLPSLGPDYMPAGGTDYTGMLDAALDGFSTVPDTDRYLVVLSDGESSTEGWPARLDALYERDVHVIAIGVGTEEGGFIRDGWSGYLQDRDGGVVHTRLMPETLQALARRSNGRYLRADALADAEAVRGLLAETVERGRRGQVRHDGGASGWQERFQWALLPALLLVLLALLRDFHPRPRPRRIRRREPAPQRGGSLLTVVLLAALAVPDARAHFDDDADFDVREVFDSNPLERLRAIVRHLAEYGYDAYDIRLMVEEAIKYGIDSQRLGLQPKEGVLRDAIEATHTGEALDEGIASWSFYRARLETMLEPLEQAEAIAREEREERLEIMDEEDTPPTVAGQSTMQSGGDSFGQGAASASDAALGDLTAGPDTEVQRRPASPPPADVQAATLRESRSGGAGADDPILEMSRQRMNEVVRGDSPARLHQLLVDETAEQESNRFDW